MQQLLSILSLLFWLQLVSNVAPNLAQKETNKMRRLTEAQLSTEEIFITDTIRLLGAGDAEIVLGEATKEIVIAIGLTGAGKTTMTKFIANPETLEAYETTQTFLIRDKEKTISEKSTIVSKTIFPERLLDPSTKCVFYDMPGFSDTRNTSIEIANAWFMKKVANHASSVKILFVVGHSTVKAGEHRDIFLKLLTHATEYIKEPKKFSDAISLVVSKVGIRRNKNVEDVIEDIADFLITVKSNLGEVSTDSEKQRRASDLIDAFLTKGSDGSYSKISFFRQPKAAGPLTEIPEVMAQRSHMKQVIENNTVFVNSSPDDFGISVSSGGQLLSLNLTRITNDKITSVILSIQDKIERHYTKTIPVSPLISVGTLLKEFEALENIPAVLKGVKEERKAYLLQLTSMLAGSKFNFTQDNVEIHRLTDNLDFFEKVSGQQLPFSSVESIRPIKTAILSVKRSLRQRFEELNRHLVTETKKIARDFENGFHQRIMRQADESKAIIREEMLTLAARMDSFIRKSFEETIVFNQFLSNLEKFIHPLKITLFKLHHDFNIKEQNSKFGLLVLKLSQWLAPFKSLRDRLITKSSALEVQIHYENSKKYFENKLLESERTQNLLTKNISALKLNNSKTEIEIGSEGDIWRRRISLQQENCTDEIENVLKLHKLKLEQLEKLHEQSNSNLNLDIRLEKQKGESIQLVCIEKIATLVESSRQEKQDHDRKLKEINKDGDEKDEQSRVFHIMNMQQAQQTCMNNLQSQDKICNQQLAHLIETSDLLRNSFQDKQIEDELTCRAKKQIEAQDCNAQKSSVQQKCESEVKSLKANLDQVTNACNNDINNIEICCNSQINRFNTLASQIRQKLDDELEVLRNTYRRRAHEILTENQHLI